MSRETKVNFYIEFESEIFSISDICFRYPTSHQIRLNLAPTFSANSIPKCLQHTLAAKMHSERDSEIVWPRSIPVPLVGS